MAKIKITILDQRYEMTMTSAQETLVRKALSSKYGYRVNINNPSFNSALPIDPVTNPQMIANPESEGDFIAKSVLAELLSGAKALRVSEKQQTKINEASTETNTEFASITITEEVAP